MNELDQFVETLKQKFEKKVNHILNAEYGKAHRLAKEITQLDGEKRRLAVKEMHKAKNKCVLFLQKIRVTKK